MSQIESCNRRLVVESCEKEAKILVEKGLELGLLGNEDTNGAISFKNGRKGIED